MTHVSSRIANNYAISSPISNLVIKYGTRVSMFDWDDDDFWEVNYILPSKKGYFYLYESTNGVVHKCPNYISFLLFEKSLEEVLREGSCTFYGEQEEYEEYYVYQSWSLPTMSGIEFKTYQSGYDWEKSLEFEERYNYIPERGRCWLNDHLRRLTEVEKSLRNDRREYPLRLIDVLKGFDNRHQYCLEGTKDWAARMLPSLYDEICEYVNVKDIPAHVLKKVWVVNRRNFINSRYNPLP